MKRRRPDLIARFLLALSALLTTAACTVGSPYAPIQIRTNTFTSHGRIARAFYSTDQTRATFQFGVTHAGGDESQVFGGATRLGGVTFSNSEQLNTTFGLTTYDGSVGVRRFMNRLPFGVDLSAGMAYTRLNIALSSASVRTSETVSSPAFQLHMGGIWSIVSRARVEASVTTLVTRVTAFEDVTRTEVSGEYDLGPHFTIRGGYSDWTVDAPMAGRSALELRFRGPALGAAFNF